MNVYEKFEYLESKGWEWYDEFPHYKYPKVDLDQADYPPTNEPTFVSPLLEQGKIKFWFTKDKDALINFCYEKQKEKANV